jgi:hypothetical protein
MAAVALALAAPPSLANAAPSPHASVAGVVSLNAIACPTATHCVAVGSDSGLNGKGVVVNTASASGTTGPGTVTNVSLSAVACAVPTTCVAVGVGGIARVTVANGAPSLVGKVSVPKGELAPLDSIACPNPTECFAGGWIGTYGHSKALVARLGATGAVLSTMQENGTSGVGGIACTTSTQCLLAVADLKNPEKIQLLTNGHLGTSHVLAPNTYVQALACYKSVVCYALAGRSSKTNLIYEINTLTGAIMAGHSIGGGFSGDGIACATANQCIITGFSSLKPSIVIATKGIPGAPRHVGGSGVSGVGCTDTNSCFAVGQAGALGLVERV